jgi:GT2 family glycosyltransferase
MPDFTKCGVSIAIPNYNGRALLEECLPSIVEALNRHGHPDNEICIADDGSTDGSVEFLQKNYPNVKLVRAGERSGAPNAFNRAISNCKNEIVVVHDNDVKVEKDYIAPLLAHFNEPEVFAVTMRALGFDKKSFRSAGKVGRFKRGFIRAWENYNIKDANTAHPAKKLKLYSFFGMTAHVAYRKSMFDSLGGLDLLYSPYIWEDTDICYRAWKRGWVTIYEPGSLVYHRWNSTIALLSPGSRQAMISARNRLIFHWKNIGDLDMLLVHIAGLAVRTLFSLLTFRRSFLVPLWQAVKLLPEIRAKRAEDKKHWVLSDRDILNRPLGVLKEPGVFT